MTFATQVETVFARALQQLPVFLAKKRPFLDQIHQPVDRARALLWSNADSGSSWGTLMSCIALISERDGLPASEVAGNLHTMLLEKNAAYGNAALDPIRMFSQAPRTEQIRVRIDDKLSRMARGHAAGEDVLVDLAGYQVLLIIAEDPSLMKAA